MLVEILDARILDTLDTLDTRILDTVDNVSATRSLLNGETSLVGVRDVH